MSMKIEYPHTLSLDDSRARIKALGQYLQSKHGINVTWEGDDRAAVNGRYMVVQIEGVVALTQGKVTFDGKDPGFLWRNKAKEYLTAKLKKYLDPSVTVDQLPKA